MGVKIIKTFYSQVECPPYANTACYKTVSEHVEKGQIAVEVYRGCSTFALKVKVKNINLIFYQN